MIEDLREAFVKKYEDLYEEEGYHLALSSFMYFPYFVCNIHGSAMVYCPMTSLDISIVQLLKRGIGRIEDISFVLALECTIVEEVLKNLDAAGIVRESGESYFLTEGGEKLYLRQVKQEQQEINYDIYVNAITGEFTLEEHGFCEEKLPEKAVVLKPEILVDKELAKQETAIWNALEKRNHIRIKQGEIRKKAELRYKEYCVLFYRKKEHKWKFNVCDIMNQCFDVRMNEVLLRKYEEQSFFEMMGIEKYLQEEKHLLEQYAHPLASHKYYRNQQIRDLFKDVFHEARESIIIVSPWMNKRVVTEALLRDMDAAVRDRGVQLFIGYGMCTAAELAEKMEKYERTLQRERGKIENDVRTELLARELRERYQCFPNFVIRHMGTHEKILSYDGRYTIVGSFNFLSYDGGESNDYQGSGFRLEGGAFIDDKDFAAYIRQQIL